jgi:ubiquinone/menaquinone biosynthesis C-methylase UbiE
VGNPDGRSGHVCPWWTIWTFDNPLRRLFHDPATMLGAWAGPGQTAVDIGCGAGYFTLGLARLVGEAGRVIAVDLQPQMLDRVRRRAERAGLAGRIRLHRCRADTLGLEEAADFVLAFWMAHEVPDPGGFFHEVRRLLKPGGRLLVTEPVFHVGSGAFAATLEHAAQAGLRLSARPEIRLSRAALLE